MTAAHALQPEEVAAILAQFAGAGIVGRLEVAGGGTASVTYVVDATGGRYFLRRRNPRYTAEEAVVEGHGLMEHLAAHGVPVVLACAVQGAAERRWLRRGPPVGLADRASACVRPGPRRAPGTRGWPAGIQERGATMTRLITLAALQPALHPVAEDDPARARAERLRAGAALIEEAARRGATVACLPECFPTMGLGGATAARLAEDETLPGVAELGAVARHHGMTLVVGVHRRAADGRIYNTAAVVDDGQVVGLYDKVHPTRSEQEPPLGVTPGAGFPVFRLSWGTAGVLICHDNSFVESARCLALAGAEVLFWPHVQSAWGDVAWEAVLRARAIDNGVWVVSSCFSVAEGRAWRPGMMLGRSSIVAPDGVILADAGHHPGLAVTTLDLDRPRLAHDFTHSGDHPFRIEMLGDRRPDAYGIIATGSPAEARQAELSSVR